MTFSSLLLVLLVLCMSSAALAGKRERKEKTKAPELVEADERVNEALGDWCRNGFPTKTTDECICATHEGFFCEGEDCQSGYGMSFFAKSCERCACKPSDEWGERKGAMKAQRQKGKGKGKKKSKKVKKNKKSDPMDD